MVKTIELEEDVYTYLQALVHHNRNNGNSYDATVTKRIRTSGTLPELHEHLRLEHSLFNTIINGETS